MSFAFDMLFDLTSHGYSILSTASLMGSMRMCVCHVRYIIISLVLVQLY